MLRKFICATVIVAKGVGVALGEDFIASIKKVEDGKVTFTKFKKGEKSEDATLLVAGKVKVSTGAFNKTQRVEAGDAIPDGIKSRTEYQIVLVRQLLRT